MALDKNKLTLLYIKFSTSMLSVFPSKDESNPIDAMYSICSVELNYYLFRRPYISLKLSDWDSASSASLSMYSSKKT